MGNDRSLYACTIEKTLGRRRTATAKHGTQQFTDGRIPKLFLYDELNNRQAGTRPSHLRFKDVNKKDTMMMDMDIEE